MNNLKPCPFCAGKAFVRYVLPMSAVQCEKCGATAAVYADEYEAEDSKPKAIEAWNRRVDDDTKRKIG